jgi:excisionase family DNA binding protein
MSRRYYTIAEAAERLSVSHDTISRLIARRALPAIRVSERLYRIPVTALERYERGSAVTPRRVVRRRVDHGVEFGAGETIPDLEPA